MSKSCGECSLCCKVLGIAEIDKQPGAWCSHVARGKGCGIYASRPAACAGFECLWLDSEKLDDRWRPDRARFVMYAEQNDRRLNIVVDPGFPEAWRREPYYSRLKAMSRRAVDGYEMMVCIGQRRIVVFPDQEADLGLVDPEHKVISGYGRNAEGDMVPFAIVASDAEAAAAP